MERIGIRELRQHASRYLTRVAAGERLEVTDRGRPIALLVPVEPDPWEALLATSRIAPASGALLDEPPGSYAVEASAVLRALRAER